MYASYTPSSAACQAHSTNGQSVRAGETSYIVVKGQTKVETSVLLPLVRKGLGFGALAESIAVCSLMMLFALAIASTESLAYN